MCVSVRTGQLNNIRLMFHVSDESIPSPSISLSDQKCIFFFKNKIFENVEHLDTSTISTFQLLADFLFTSLLGLIDFYFISRISADHFDDCEVHRRPFCFPSHSSRAASLHKGPALNVFFFSKSFIFHLNNRNEWWRFIRTEKSAERFEFFIPLFPFGSQKCRLLSVI